MKARFTLAGTALCALLLGGIFFAACEVQTVHFVNALDIPVSVTVDGARLLPIPSGGRTSKGLVSGLHRVEVRTVDGKPLEQGELYVQSNLDRAVVWNVLGAAPLYMQSYVYTRRARSSSRPLVTTYAGTRLVDQEHVDYLFATPPRSISTKGGGSVTKVQLAEAPGGWRTSLTVLENEERYALLAKLGEALLQVDPTREEPFEAALKGWYHQEGPEAALAFLRRTMKAHPDLLPAHEKYQQFLQALGERERVRGFYAGLLEKAPASDSVVVQFLLAGVEPPAEALARLEKLVEQEPTRGRLRRERARLRFLTGRYEDAVADYEALLEPKKPVEPDVASAYLRSLVALGRAPAALTLAAGFGEAEAKPDWRIVILYGRLSGFVPEAEWPKDLPFFVERANAGRSDRLIPVWIAARLGQEVSEADLRALPDDEMRQALAIQKAAWKSAEQAWRESHNASVSTLEMLDTSTTLLLAAEFERVGATALAGKLFGTLALHTPLSREELRTAVFAPEGEAVLAHLDPEWRAAVLLARARRMDAQGLDSRDTYAAVARSDILQGVVTSAMRQWTRPARGEAPVQDEALRLVTPRAEAVSNGAP
jgi:tetratricopeptide (TPR) repeat protein